MTSQRTGEFLAAFWLLSLVTLSAAPVLKIGDVQAIELVQVLWLCLALPRFIYGGMKIPVAGIWERYGGTYLVFLALCAAGSLLALRLPFYTPLQVSFLKQPVVLSVSRIFELFLVVYFTLAAARTLANRPGLRRRALDAYCRIGLFSACISIAAWAVMKVLDIRSFLVYGYDERVRGFFNEGGPYGMFLVSVALVALLRAHLYPPRHRLLDGITLVILLTALFLSGSKAGLLAAMILSAVGLTATVSRRQRLVLLAAGATAVFVLLTVFPGKLLGYVYVYANFDEALAYRPGDTSLIMGRVAAGLIVPRMIAAHPVAGIGIGNYSLMRNDPEYLQGLPPVDDWDLPGAGLFGSAAEFGIPLTLAFTALLLQPLLRARKRQAATAVTVAAAFQPVAFLLSVNLNFFYPWLVAAFVISLESAPDQRVEFANARNT